MEIILFLEVTCAFAKVTDARIDFFFFFVSSKDKVEKSVVRRVFVTTNFLVLSFYERITK
jgi:hypothetical protein